jgi:hypothetical protein
MVTFLKDSTVIFIQYLKRVWFFEGIDARALYSPLLSLSLSLFGSSVNEFTRHDPAAGFVFLSGSIW